MSPPVHILGIGFHSYPVEIGDNIQRPFGISPTRLRPNQRFLPIPCLLQLHIVKNFLVDAGCFDASLRIPLILGIWGGKGQGKSFQTELAFKKLQ